MLPIHRFVPLTIGIGRSAGDGLQEAWHQVQLETQQWQFPVRPGKHHFETQIVYVWNMSFIELQRTQYPYCHFLSICLCNLNSCEVKGLSSSSCMSLFIVAKWMHYIAQTMTIIYNHHNRWKTNKYVSHLRRTWIYCFEIGTSTFFLFVRPAESPNWQKIRLVESFSLVRFKGKHTGNIKKPCVLCVSQ